jgi:hypothetical protein
MLSNFEQLIEKQALEYDKTSAPVSIKDLQHMIYSVVDELIEHINKVMQNRGKADVVMSRVAAFDSYNKGCITSC